MADRPNTGRVPTITSNREPSINVDLWFGTAWMDEDVRDFTQVLEPFGTVSGQRSYGFRGLGLEILIAFAAGAVAGGFFNALGEDLYLSIKKKIADIVGRPAKRVAPNEDRLIEKSDLLGFIIKDDALKVDMHLYGSYRTAKELYEYLAAVPVAFDAIWDAISTGRYPCIHNREHFVRAHWRRDPDPEWDMSILVRDSSDDSTQWQVSLDAFVFERDLNRKKWEAIQWMDSEEGRKHRAKKNNSA